LVNTTATTTTTLLRPAPSIAHIILNPESTGKDGEIMQADTEVPVVMMPNGDLVEEIKKRTRVYFHDLKTTSEAEGPVSTKIFGDAQKKSFNAVALACFSNGQKRARTLLTVAKVLEFDSSVASTFSFKNSTPVGQGELPPVTTIKVPYAPPTSTLQMNFNSNGLFLIV
jgi:hypothetical protein